MYKRTTTENTSFTILIVDDIPAEISVIAESLQTSGYRVLLAQDGAEALQCAELAHPDLIMLDVMMPELDGFEVCRRLKKLPNTRDIPVIFMTAHFDDERKVAGFEVGAVDYVSKSLQIEEINARVSIHLNISAMQKRLEMQNAQLQRYREQLEQRVAERTMELNASNQRLRAEIQERKKSQDELAAREREFRTLAENAPDNIIRYDMQGRMIYINSRLMQTMAANGEKLLGKTSLEAYPDGGYAAYHAKVLQVAGAGESGEIEIVVPGAGGSASYHHVSFVAEQDAAGEVCGVLAIGRDITERKGLEQALKIREAELRSVLNSSPYSVIRYDLDGRMTYVNAPLLGYFGLPLAALVGKRPGEVWPDGQFAEIDRGIASVRETEQSVVVEFSETIAAGEIIYHQVTIVPERGASGEMAGIIAFGLDITERRRAERELHLRNRALDNSFDATYLFDIDLRVRYVSDSAVRALGYSREELLSMNLLDIDPNVTREMMQGLMAQTAAGASFTDTVESKHRRKNGEIFPIEVGATTFSYGGETLFLTSVRDISERKHAERELLVLNHALNTSSDAAFLMNEQGRFVYVNDSACKSLAYSREELLSMCPLDIDANLTDEIFRKMQSDLFSLGPNRGMIESRHRRRDGHIFPIELAASILELEGTRYSLSIVRDITERKEAERLLHGKGQAIRAVVENSPDTIIRYDNQCRRIYLNPVMEKVFGQPREQLHGTSPSEFSPLPALYLTAIKEVLETGSEQRMESSFRNAEGEMRWVDLRLAPEFCADGKVATVLVIGRDITERKRAEEELAEREQRYREIFDNAVEGMYLLEVTEEGRFRNLDINPALAASTGIPREAMVGQFVDDTVPEEMGKRIVEKYRRCVAAGETIAEFIELDLPAGHRHYYSTITPIYFGGRVHRLIGISRDITDLKKAECELQESREQLRGLTARREATREEERKYIAREVHDELGQVLTGLQLNISVLEHKFASNLPALSEHLKETKALTDRALGGARNVASALRPAALDLGINSALEWLVGRFSANTGIRCKLDLSLEEIPIDESHAMALFRIVQESLTNISRHAKASKVDVSLAKDGDDYLLNVSDNGKGFESNIRKSDSYGLVGIKERALMLGGKVIIESKPGKGTRISVRIPVNQNTES